MGELGAGGVIETAELLVGAVGKGGAGAAEEEEGVGGWGRDDAGEGRGGDVVGGWPRWAGEESPEDVDLGANGSDPRDVRGLEGEKGTGETRREGRGPREAQPGRAGRGVGEGAPGSARVGMIAALAEQMTTALAVGDVEAAGVAFEAIGRLLPGRAGRTEEQVRERPHTTLDT